MNRLYYVIITPWDDVLYKLDAWSDNYYLISMYYRQYKRKQPLSSLEEYNISSILEFADKMKIEYDASIDNILDNRLSMVTSKDNKLCAIFKHRYIKSFNNISKPLLRDSIGHLTKSFLSITSMLKYLDDDYNILYALVFVCYGYRLNPEYIDLVYLWFFLLKTVYTNSINTIDTLIPYDTVFIRVDEY